jgi:hypothetical protein
MVCVGRNFVAYLRFCITGCSFLIMFVMVVWCFLLSSTVIPRSFDCGFWSIFLPLMSRWISFSFLGWKMV